MGISKGTVLVLGGGADQVPLVEELANRGYYTVIVDYTDDPPARALASEHCKESSLDLAKVLELATEVRAVFLTSLGNDRVLPVIASVSEKLNLLTPLSADAALISTDKARMRAAFLHAGVSVPHTQVVGDLAAFVPTEMPVVVKPLRGTSSEGVLRLEDEAELKALVQSAAKDGGLIVQQYIQGIEVSVDCFAVDGVAQVILVNELIQVPGIDQGFAIMATRYPAPIGEAGTLQMNEQAQRVAQAFGLRNGPFFYQAKVDGGRVYVLEGSARIAGGLKYRTIRNITGFDMLAAQVDALEGRAVQPLIRSTHKAVVQLFLYSVEGILAGIELPDDPRIVHAQAFRKAGDVLSGGTAAKDRVLSLTIAADRTEDMAELLRTVVAQVVLTSQDGQDLLRRDLPEAMFTP